MMSHSLTLAWDSSLMSASAGANPGQRAQWRGRECHAMIVICLTTITAYLGRVPG